VLDAKQGHNAMKDIISNDAVITIRLPENMLKSLADLRRAEPSLPTRAGMIRLLVEKAAAELHKRKR
jgi:hypothetical protein